MLHYKIIAGFIFGVVIVVDSLGPPDITHFKSDQDGVSNHTDKDPHLYQQKDKNYIKSEFTDNDKTSDNSNSNQSFKELPRRMTNGIRKMNGMLKFMFPLVESILNRQCDIDKMLRRKFKKMINQKNLPRAYSNVLRRNGWRLEKTLEVSIPCARLAFFRKMAGESETQFKTNKTTTRQIGANGNHSITKTDKENKDKKLKTNANHQTGNATRAFPRKARSLPNTYIRLPNELEDLMQNEVSNDVTHQLNLSQKYRDVLDNLLWQNKDSWIKYADHSEPTSVTSKSSMLKVLNSFIKRRFNSWGGKRNAPYNKRVSFNSWGGKRSAETRRRSTTVGLRLDDSKTMTEPLKRTQFNSWGGKRAYIPVTKKRGFHSWAGKRASYWHGFDADFALNDDNDDNLEIYVRSDKRKDPYSDLQDENRYETERQFLNLDVRLWQEEPTSKDRVILYWQRYRNAINNYAQFIFYYWY